MVSVDGTGNFRCGRSEAARLQAATTTGLVVDTDTFTVRVSDGQAFTDVPVTVVVRPGQLATGAPVDVGRDPSGVAFNADGTRAYVTNEWDKTVSVVNTSSGAVLATIKVPYAPNAVVVSPVAGQNRAYVAMSTGVAVIDTATNKVVDVKPSTRTVDTITVGALSGCRRWPSTRRVRGCMSATLAAPQSRWSTPPPTWRSPGSRWVRSPPVWRSALMGA